MSDVQKLYVLERNGWAKIGISVDPHKRENEIQTSNPYPVNLASIIDTDCAVAVEEILHKYFQEYRSHGGSEWFNLPSEEIEKLTEFKELSEIEAVARYTDSDIDPHEGPIFRDRFIDLEERVGELETLEARVEQLERLEALVKDLQVENRLLKERIEELEPEPKLKLNPFDGL